MEHETRETEKLARVLAERLAAEPALTLARLRSNATIAFVNDRGNERLQEWRRFLNQSALTIRDVLIAGSYSSDVLRAAPLERIVDEVETIDDVEIVRDEDLVKAMNPSDRFAYELHRAVAERMRTEPDAVVRHAIENLETRKARTGKPHVAEDIWRDILSRPNDEAIEAFLDLSETGQVLRS
jgi:hypothetical protein